jgi:HEPN domain-containing protein
VTRVLPRTVPVPRARSSVFLRRGNNLFALAEAALHENNHDGAATCAIQASIALADALTVRRLGLRSRGQDHREVVALVAQMDLRKGDRISTLIQAILDRKTDVEYGDTEVSKADARQLVAWAREQRELVLAEHA